VVASIGPAAPALLDARARAIAEATAAAAAAAVDLARAEVEQTAAALDFAQHEAARARTLFGRGALSERERDNAALAESTAVAAAASARAHLTVREKEFESARAVIDSIVAASGGACCVDVVSPLAGRVLRVVTEDEQVLQVGTPILEVGDTADLAVVADVLSRDAVGMRVGADAVVTGWGGADLAARVQRIKPVAVTKVSALGVEEQRVEVELALRDVPLPELGHGFRVTARITVWQQSAALAVSIAALFRDGADWAVFAVQDGRAALRKIDLGPRNEDFAQVLGGLVEGDRVILHPDDTITSGTKVTEE
jgi:HlyD family secretion protein